MNDIFYVRRLKSDCCGMKVGSVYQARWNPGSPYLSVRLDDGTWTSSHWIGDFFELLSTDITV